MAPGAGIMGCGRQGAAAWEQVLGESPGLSRDQWESGIPSRPRRRRAQCQPGPAFSIYKPYFQSSQQPREVGVTVPISTEENRSSKRPPPARGAGLVRGSVRTDSSPAPMQRLRGPQVPPSALQPVLWPQGEPWIFTSFCPGTSGTRRALARAPSRQLPDCSAVPSGSHVDPHV